MFFQKQFKYKTHFINNINQYLKQKKWKLFFNF